MSTDEEWAWAAGLFEGEGSFGQAKTTKVISMSLGTTDIDVLQKFHRIVNLGSIHGPRIRDGNKPSWEWMSSSPREIMARFEPYLGERRLARMREIQQIRNDYLRSRCNSQHCAHCGVWFTTYSVNGRGAPFRKYCTTLCSTNANSRRVARQRRDNPPPLPPCKNCGGEIPRTWARRIFCSKSCNVSWHTKNSNAKRKTRVANV